MTVFQFTHFFFTRTWYLHLKSKYPLYYKYIECFFSIPVHHPSHTSSSHSQHSLTKSDDLYVNDEPPPKMLPLRPIIRGPYSENGDDDDHSSETTIVYTEQHTEVKLNCEVDLDIAAVVWMHNGQVSSLISHVYCYFFAQSFFPPYNTMTVMMTTTTMKLAKIKQEMMKYDIFFFSSSSRFFRLKKHRFTRE